MPVLDGNFEAFVTNLGKYNEGMLVGEWVKLPTTEEEMQKVFERIGIGKQDEFGQPLSLIHKMCIRDSMTPPACLTSASTLVMGS